MMTIEEAKQAHVNKSVVVFKGHDHYIDHIQSYYENGWKNALFLVPCDGYNSAVVARMKDCELKGENTDVRG